VGFAGHVLMPPEVLDAWVRAARRGQVVTKTRPRIRCRAAHRCAPPEVRIGCSGVPAPVHALGGPPQGDRIMITMLPSLLNSLEDGPGAVRPIVTTEAVHERCRAAL
jgi:hypothetical protein